MKIKTWLLLSYVIVMLLPLIAGYLLFAWITSYDQDQKISEHLQVLSELETVKTVLANETLYTSKEAQEKNIPPLTDELSITLLNKDGLILYSSDHSAQSTLVSFTKEELYESLYELKQGYHSYTYKQPVFSQNEIIGFFHIEKSRQQWVEAVSDRTIIVIVSLLIIFSLVFFTVVKMMNRKLNRPLQQLMSEMSSFAAGETIIERKVTNDEIGQLKSHFYKMSQKINEAQQTIEQEQQTKQYMIASVSHDLKTPLTSIKAYAESLQNELLESEVQKEYYQVIRKQATFMQHMLDDLLTYTQLQSPTYEVERVIVDGTEFFEMLLSGYGALAEQYQVNLQTNIAVSGSYFINPEQMMRVIDNLMSNALKYTPKDKNIYLAAISNGEVPAFLLKEAREKYSFNFAEYVYLIVQNEGKGIHQDDLREIFLPLYQTDQSRSKSNDEGTGLGLSIAKQIIEKHAGTIDIYSEIEVGTCVICQIPKLKKG